MTHPLGKRAATADDRDLLYASIRPKGLVVPKVPKPHGGFGMQFGDWLMLGNGPDDSVFPGFAGGGDCFWAGQAHSIMEANRNAERAVPAFSGKTVIDQYSAYSGFDPHTGANDNGTDVREGLKWHQKHGIYDDAGKLHKIGPYFKLAPGNFQHMWEVLWFAECLGVGIYPFPQSAFDQFDHNNETWSYVPGSPGEGGHWIIVVGHPVASIWTGVTWGARQTMVPQFLTHYNDELWAWIDRERYNDRTGETFERIEGADVERYLALEGKALAQQFG